MKIKKVESEEGGGGTCIIGRSIINLEKGGGW
jgi:hypothetical protein